MAVLPNDKPHAVVIPFPAQSHIKGMLKLAKLLHSRGFFITFVNTEFNQNRYIKNGGSHSLGGDSSFQFKSIPDSLPPSEADATQDVASLCRSIRRDFLAPFLDLIAELNREAAGSEDAAAPPPPVTCIVSDGAMAFATVAAKELGIPIAAYWTFPACAVMAFSYYRTLLKKGLTTFKGANMNLFDGCFETVVDWVPGMKNIRVKDLPNFFQTPDMEEIFHLAMEGAESSRHATAFGLQTFDALEPDVLHALSTMFSHVHTIGPLQLLLNKVPEKDRLDSVGYSLWKEEEGCIQWLSTKKPGSVVYVNFGSVAVLTEDQLVEFAMGLANSNKSFLWIIRPDLVVGESNVLPAEFEEAVEKRGMIASWCPQEQVLNHRAIGGFLTHGGWNSIMESLSAGVPMMCWPFFGDQQTNCRYLYTEWEVGMEIDNDVKRDEVEKLVIELIEGVKGKRMKSKAMEWKKRAGEATDREGSSTLNFDRLVRLLQGKHD